MVKIKLEKVYNKIEWYSIHWSLVILNFPMWWTKFIDSCLSTTSIEIIINGSIPMQFQPSRWLRQRDPLSPHFFILEVEFLSRLIETEFESRN